MDPMQVDLDTSKVLPLGAAFTLSQPLPTGPPKPDSELRKINAVMNKWTPFILSTLIPKAGDDKDSIKAILAIVFVQLTLALPLKAEFIAPISPSNATEMIGKLDDDEIKDWWKEVKIAVDKGNWGILASHCTF
jgi:hypothetical protein